MNLSNKVNIVAIACLIILLVFYSTPFKDEKMRISALHINKISAMVGSNPLVIRHIQDFYCKKGEVK
ncbi:MAG: hypothetical protein EOO99_08055 [Pedobacter sp.]|nr:MAG: hypothetical protein EOO99_08055 [Pedobacter sp.]